MSYGALIAYRNLVWESMPDYDDIGAALDGELSSLLTPQLGDKVRFTPLEGIGGHWAVSFSFDLAEPSTVQLIGLLNITLRTVTEINVRLLNASSALIAELPWQAVTYPPEDYLPSNAWVLAENPVPNVARVLISCKLLPSTVPAVQSTLELGGVWLGPAWVLKSLGADWQVEIAENAVKTESDGNQTRARPQRRYRVLTFSLRHLKESEVLGIPPDEKDPAAKVVSPENTLIDLGFYSGVSLPIVVMPRISRIERIHALGIYGYLSKSLILQPSEAPDGPGSPVRGGAQNITLRESL